MKIAVRMDDITPDMDWKSFLKFEKLLDKYGIAPLIGVVPCNRDTNLMREASRVEFWDYVHEFDLAKSIADFLVGQNYEAVDVIVRLAAIQANEPDLKRYILREVSKKKH